MDVDARTEIRYPSDRTPDQASRFEAEEPEFSSSLLSVNCINTVCLPPQEELVKHYAWIGLHRYNLLKGTKFELCYLIKYNSTMSVANSFYITLSARDADESPKIFQVQVDERVYGFLDVVCSVARIKGDTPEPYILPAPMDRLPNWPSDEVFGDFYLVEGSELLDNGWIRKYLELVVIANDKSYSDEEGFLSNLEIEKAAIETTEDSPLSANSATIYITFKGLYIDSDIETYVEPKAIIKRVLDERTGLLSLKGSLCFGGGRTLPTDEPLYSRVVRRLPSDEPLYSRVVRRSVPL